MPRGPSVHFSVLDANTTPEGGKCDPAATLENQCNDAFGTGVTLTSSWQQFTFYLGPALPGGVGQEPGRTALAADASYSVRPQLAKSAKFDVAISYIAFTQ